MMHQRYYSSPPIDAEASPPGRPWAMMLLLAGVFFVTHPHKLDESMQFNEVARAGGVSVKDGANSNAEAVAEGSPKRRIGLIVLGLAAVYSMASFHGPALRINGWLGWLTIGFLALMFLSPLWAANSFLSIRRVVAVGLLSLTALAAAKRFSISDLLLFIVLSTGVYLLIGILTEVRFGNFRPWASGYRFGGTLHPNRQGMNCTMLALAAVVYAAQVPSERRRFWVIAAVAMLFLILTGSRTSLVSAVFGLGVFALLRFPFIEILRYGAIAVASGAVLVGIGAATAGEELDRQVESVVLLGRDSEGSESGSFNGRLPLWQECSAHVARHPWLGYGYKSFWTPQQILTVSAHQGWSIMHAHNGYLEMALNVGMIGAVLFVAILFLAIKHSFHLFSKEQSAGAAFAASLLCWSATNLLLESWLDEPLLPSFVTLTIIASLAALETPLWQRTATEPTASGIGSPTYTSRSLPAVG